MKRCPRCNQLFTDDNFFCLDDGTSLLLSSDTAQNPPVFQTSSDQPTLIVPRSQTIAPNPVNNPSKWLYLIIGVMGTALVAMAIFMFLPRNTSDKSETTNQNTKTEQTSKAAENTGQAETFAAKNTQQNTQQTSVNASSQTKTNPNLTPGGSWSGDWNSKTTYFTATADFTESGGKVSGQIVWTIRRTTNPKKIDKIGTSAVEYVQGTFNPVTRMLSLKGYRKDDPNNIVILDRYNLSLTEDNQTLSGKSIGGNFVLRR
jgi:hypothetical protein